jgi:hypothetical protein
MPQDSKLPPPEEIVVLDGPGGRGIFSTVVSAAIVLGAIGAIVRTLLKAMSGEVPWLNLAYIVIGAWSLLLVFNGIMYLIDAFSRTKVEIRIDREKLKQAGIDLTPEQAEKIVRDVIESRHAVSGR